MDFSGNGTKEGLFVVLYCCPPDEDIATTTRMMKIQRRELLKCYFLLALKR